MNANFACTRRFPVTDMEAGMNLSEAGMNMSDAWMNLSEAGINLSEAEMNPSKPRHMMTSSNGNIFRVTGPLCGEFTGPGEFPTQRPVTRSFDVFFDLGLNKRLSNQPWGWWFETPSWSLWRHCNEIHLNQGVLLCLFQIYFCLVFWPTCS